MLQLMKDIPIGFRIMILALAAVHFLAALLLEVSLIPSSGKPCKENRLMNQKTECRIRGITFGSELKIYFPGVDNGLPLYKFWHGSVFHVGF